jgi:transposase InsO family protein
MVSPTRRREAVACLRRSFPGVSERRACKVVGQPRNTQRYRPGPRKKSEDALIVKKMHELVRRHPRFGYRRIHVLLVRCGFRINRKRVWRLWKQECFKVPVKQVKKRRLGCSENGIVRRRAEHIDHVWAWDFIHDRDENGRPIRWLSIVDEFTRECLCLEGGRSFKSGDVLDVLRELFVVRGVPGNIRSDNGPEFVAKAIRGFLETAQVETLYIEPGAPWENGYAESFHSRLRDELLDAELFADLREARALASSWKNDYNHRRPHSSLGYQTPAEYAAQLRGPLRHPPVGATPLPPAASADQPLTLITRGT